jgi:hypothetical protein
MPTKKFSFTNGYSLVNISSYLCAYRETISHLDMVSNKYSGIMIENLHISGGNNPNACMPRL